MKLPNSRKGVSSALIRLSFGYTSSFIRQCKKRSPSEPSVPISVPEIDIAVFGETISIIKKRETLDNKSIIQSYEEAISIFKDYYSFEVIDGANREKVETIPEAPFREAIANAIIHRLWDVKSQIRVSMFDDYVEVISPGGLPTGISKNEYVDGGVSILRNPIIANVFNRLQYAISMKT